jgi:hypothetical protein
MELQRNLGPFLSPTVVIVLSQKSPFLKDYIKKKLSDKTNHLKLAISKDRPWQSDKSSILRK